MMAELTRSYNQVSTTLPHSSWRRRLTALQKALWDDLISWPTYCGVIRVEPDERAWYHNCDVTEIESALDRFVNDGKIKRDGEYIYVIEFISHQSFNPNLRVAAANEARSREARTSLASECLRNLNGTLPEGMPNQLYTILDDTIQDDSSILAGTAKQRQPAKRKPRARKPEPEKYVTLARELAWFIDRKVEAYNVPHGGYSNDPQDCARELRLLCEADGFNIDDILPCLAWAWTDQWPDCNDRSRTVIYGALMISIMQWRTRDKWRKCFAKWSSKGAPDMGADGLRADIKSAMEDHRE